jgi:predicted transcriptional regulator of viral defense system
MYVTNEYFQKNKGDTSYAFYLANVLCQPSYVSSWAALQYYNLATEAVYTITSVTPKITRAYNNKAGNFAYHSIKKELFSDFSLIQGSFDFFIASPAKALFDLIYFKTNQFKGLHISDLEPLIEEDLRIDIDEMDPKEKEHFYNLIKKYLK